MIQAWIVALLSVGIGLGICLAHWNREDTEDSNVAGGCLQGLVLGVLWVGLLWLIAAHLGIAP